MSLDLRVKKVRSLISKSKKAIMFFDSDTDGMTSYFQLSKVFPNIVNAYSMQKEFEKQDLMIDKIDDSFDLVIFFDVPVISEKLIKSIKSKRIIWADHHPSNSKELILKYQILHLNPLNYDDNDSRPSCYMAYLVANLKENLPLVSLGSVSDFYLLDILIKFYDYDPKLFHIIFEISDYMREELFIFIRTYKFNDLRVKKRRDYWIRFLTYDSNLILYKNLFDMVYKLKGKGDIFKGINLIKGLDLFEMKTLINSGKGFLFEEYSTLRTEYKKIFNLALKKVEIIETRENSKLVFFNSINKVSFSKQLSEELAHKLKNYVVVCVCFKKLDKMYWTGSLRGNNFAVNDLIVKCLSGLDGNGGGHKYSAGFGVNEKDFSIFKKRLIKFVN